MGYLLACAFASFLIAFYFVWQAHQGRSWAFDSDLSGPQKVHHRPVPRLGGVGIFAAVACSAVGARLLDNPAANELAVLLGCSLPAVAFGLAEDVTRAVSSRRRLMAAAVSAALAVVAMDVVIDRVDVPGLDAVLGLTVVALPLTIFCVTGISNSMNIIDGFNGLASMVALMIFAAIGYVGHMVGDLLVVLAALSCIGAIAGFFLWNYPLGLIFLGDGGAYFLGFMMAELAILLFHRHPEVSPWFGVLVFFYPTVETAFSIYRRSVIRGIPADTPDATHLHSLVFRRLVRNHDTGKGYVRNSSTSPYLWLLASVAVLPAALFWHHTPFLVAWCVLFVALYIYLYQQIVRFKTPRWLRRL